MVISPKCGYGRVKRIGARDVTLDTIPLHRMAASLSETLSEYSCSQSSDYSTVIVNLVLRLQPRDEQNSCISGGIHGSRLKWGPQIPPGGR